MADDRSKPGRQANEGEGNRTAAREYNQHTREFVQGEDVEKLARKAQQDLDGPQGDELRRAEEQGKAKARGEDPALTGGKR